MTSHRLTITELERESGVPRRTIHFYIRQGVLPPPEGAGGAARYGEEHLLRLRLVQELQKSHLKLAGICEALDALSLEEMRALAEPQGGEAGSWDLEALEHWLREGRRSPEPQAPVPSGLPLAEAEGFSFLAPFRPVPRPESDTAPAEPDNLLKSLRRRQKLEAEPWVRYRPVDGVEVQVRKDVLQKRRADILAWIKQGERLWKEE